MLAGATIALTSGRAGRKHDGFRHPRRGPRLTVAVVFADGVGHRNAIAGQRAKISERDHDIAVSPLSMTSNPCRSSSSVIDSGGFVKNVLKRTNV